MEQVEQVQPDAVVENVAKARGPRRWLVALVLGVALVGTATWWFTTVHPGALAQTNGLTVCADYAANGATDFTMTGVDLDPPAGATVLAVRLVEPQNVEVADARVVPISPDRTGGTNLAGFVEWPLSDPGQYTVDWSADRDLVGARLSPGTTETPYLHLHIVDPTQPASFEAWQIEYRMRATRWVSTLTTGLRQPVAPTTCDDVL